MSEDARDDDQPATAADGGTDGSGIDDASSDGASEGANEGASEDADYEDERVEGSASESDDAPDGATEVPTITAEPTDAVDRARRLAAEADRVVVKAGTNSLTDGASNLDRVKLDKLVADIMALIDQGTEVLLVSSGAIGAGKGSVDADPDTVEASQALSTVGQSDLMHQYTESFDRFDRDVAQLLLTDADLNNPERYTNVRNTVETLLSWNVVPIVNENDAVATEEIEIGDNDMLSSSVALCVDADLLVLLTDVDAVYTGNPKEDDGAERIEAVGANYDEIQALVEASASDPFGGIRTKVEGARRVSEHGIPAVVAGSATTDVLADIGSGKPVGTIFLPVNGGTDD